MLTGTLRIAPPYDEAELQSIQEGFETLLGTAIQFRVVELSLIHIFPGG